MGTYQILKEIADSHSLTENTSITEILNLAPILISEMEERNIDKLLNNIVFDFRRDISSIYYHEGKVKAYASEFYKIYKTKVLSKMLSLYTGDINSSELLPLFFHRCALKVNLKFYTPDDYDYYQQQIEKIFEIKYNQEKTTCTVDDKYVIRPEKYEIFERGISEETDDIQASVQGEFLDLLYIKYLLELERVGSPDSYVSWVAKNIGDGFGFDIHAIHPFKHKELLFESKTGADDSITMTNNEFRVAKESIPIINCEYNINKYKYKLVPNAFSSKVIITDMAKTRRTIQMNKDLNLFMEQTWYSQPIFYIALKETRTDSNGHREFIKLYSPEEYKRNEESNRERVMDEGEIETLKRLRKI